MIRNRRRHVSRVTASDMNALGSTVGLYGLSELQSLVPGVNCYIVGLSLLHLDGLGYRPVILTRLACMAVSAGAWWIAAVEFYNSLTIEGVSPFYNIGVFAVGAACVYLGRKRWRMATRDRPPALASNEV